MPYDFTVHPGAGLKAVGRQLASDGVLPEGESFWHYLEDRNTERGNGHRDGTVSVTRYVPVRIF